MRRRKKALLQEQKLGVDMTPMLDIIFILLIFFIVTTSFVKEKGFVVERSKASKTTDNSSKNIMIHTDGNSILHFNNKPIDILRLPARVELHLSNYQTSNVIFRPHEDTNYQDVVRVLDQLKQFPRLKVTLGTYKP